MPKGIYSTFFNTGPGKAVIKAVNVANKAIPSQGSPTISPGVPSIPIMRPSPKTENPDNPNRNLAALMVIFTTNRSIPV